MYDDIYLHEWLILMVNVGKYTIHESYGLWLWLYVARGQHILHNYSPKVLFTDGVILNIPT